MAHLYSVEQGIRTRKKCYSGPKDPVPHLSEGPASSPTSTGGKGLSGYVFRTNAVLAGAHILCESRERPSALFPDILAVGGGWVGPLSDINPSVMGRPLTVRPILGTEPRLTWGPPRAPGFGRAPGKYDTRTCQHHLCTLWAGDAPGPCRPIPPALPPTLMPAAQAVALASWVLAVPDSVRRDGFGSCCVKRGSTCSPSQSQTGEGGGDVDQP